ncbi:NADH-quinone oxidoreductase subunit NuoE [Motilibacter deserti]|uniref:NADH-quinone oxidoreductase subunit NuoE n=1 Tax=Motilibacter deserti TaxID=2714956 RepID=A0ABX0GWH7_9ACTN|nr:NADH-quinone oxidoreductase subunit NuoE [Motilibacter deserti]NHC15327.1 NADH-quinone oxidoreductase subunit NuoE [Motilibacter deserti]
MSLTADALSRLELDAKEVIARYPRPRSALLPLLHLVQSEEGWVSPEGIELCARWLDLTTAEVSAVATFYTMYKRRPNGDYTVGVCTNTLCAVLGGDEILARLEEHLGVHHDETTPDGKVTLEHIECNAACDYAPVVMVNWEFFDNVTPQGAVELVDRLRAGDPPAPTRGPGRLCTFKQVERVLAGFEDGLADEGVGAGPATLAGLHLARERGWAAPPPDAGGDAALGMPATGYGPGGGPSGSDAPADTAKSDPANPTPAGAPDENSSEGGKRQ